MGFGIYEAMRLDKLEKGSSYEYFGGFKTGLLTGGIATLVFVFFMGLYLFHLDTEFAQRILGSWMKSYFQGPGILLFVLLVEGFASTVIFSLLFMQRLKPSWNNQKK